MKDFLFYRVINFLIAGVWFVNGFWCKVLNEVPRHRLIVARILGDEYAAIITTAIGFAEMAMAVWILIRYFSRINAVVQIVVIASMNLLEFILAPDLLLWGRMNLVFAILFTILIYYNEFLNRHPGKADLSK